MTASGLPVKLLAWDHNWDVPSYPKDSISESAGAFAGTGWHCYAADSSMGEVQDDLHSMYPDLEQHFTECTGGYGDTCDISKGMDSFGWNHEWDMKRLFLGNTAHWGQSGTKWISALDETCGPTLEGEGLEVSSGGGWHGRPLVAIPSWASSMDDIHFNQDFWTVAHMARFVHPGSHRVTTSGDRQGQVVEAFVDEAENSITLLALNTDHSSDMQLGISYNGHHLDYTVPAWATAIIQWDSAQPSPSPSPAPAPSPVCGCGWTEQYGCDKDDGSHCFVYCCRDDHCDCSWTQQYGCGNDDGSWCYRQCCGQFEAHNSTEISV